MKVVYMGGFELPDKNAAALRVISNAKLLRQMGYEVHLVGVVKDNSSRIKLVEGFDSYSINYPTKIKEWFNYAIKIWDIPSLNLDSVGYVILYNFPSIASLRILRYCHKHNIKVVADVTEWELETGHSIRAFIHRIDICLRMRFCNKRMDGVFAISRYLLDYYKRSVKTVLVPPTIDFDAEKWIPKEKLDTTNGVNFVYAGSAGVGTKDRLDLIVAAMKRFPNLHLSVVGMTKAQYETAFGKVTYDSANIDFLGRMSHAKTLEIVRNSDFQFLIRENTRKNRAGFPTKFVESMVCGTPIIATNISNLQDYLHDGVNGFWVDEHSSIENVVSRILKLSKQEISSMQERCIEDSRVFDYRNYRDEFEQLFR